MRVFASSAFMRLLSNDNNNHALADEEDTSGSEYYVDDDDTDDMINTFEDVISDHDGLANRKWSVITLFGLD